MLNAQQMSLPTIYITFYNLTFEHGGSFFGDKETINGLGQFENTQDLSQVVLCTYLSQDLSQS